MTNEVHHLSSVYWSFGYMIKFFLRFVLVDCELISSSDLLPHPHPTVEPYVIYVVNVHSRVSCGCVLLRCFALDSGGTLLDFCLGIPACVVSMNLNLSPGRGKCLVYQFLIRRDFLFASKNWDKQPLSLLLFWNYSQSQRFSRLALSKITCSDDTIVLYSMPSNMLATGHRQLLSTWNVWLRN